MTRPHGQKKAKYGEMIVIVDVAVGYPNEIQACLRCSLPACSPTSERCNLKTIQSQKRGRRVTLK